MCAHERAVHVVDPTGSPVAGAQVHAVARYRQCGPSMMPEGCSSAIEDSPVTATDATGAAMVCSPDRGDLRLRETSLAIAYRDWPRALVPTTDAPLTIGPPRRASVLMTLAGCSDARHVQVTAHGEGAAEVVHGEAIPSTPGSYRLDGLGPWRYWVRSHDDRSGNGALEAAACKAFVRVLDRETSHLALDRSDAVVERPDFAGGRATLTARDSKVEVAHATLDDRGRAVVSLVEGSTSGEVFCLRLEREGRCEVTFARAGEISRPALYVGRAREILASCGACPSPP